MPRAGKGARYHHGDLRAAVIDTAIEIIGERGVRGFSVAEASRRLGVAASAPYAHFADRDQVLAAITVRAYQALFDQVRPALNEAPTPAERLAAMASGYVRCAAANRALFDVLYEAGLDKSRYPEIEIAEQPVAEALLDCVRALCSGSDQAAESLATAVEATARGFALLVQDGDFGHGPDAIERAAEQVTRATMALIDGRHLLADPGARRSAPAESRDPAAGR